MRAVLAIALAMIACSKAEPAGAGRGSGSAARAPSVPAGKPIAFPPPTDGVPAHPPGSWEPIGKPGGWAGTRLATTLGDHMFTIEKGDARLWDTTLATGDWIAVGKPEFGHSTHLMAAGGRLYTLETDGSLYRIDPATGRWERVGKPGRWGATRLATALGDHMYSIENDGSLRKTSLATGDHSAIGKRELAGATRLMAGRDRLYTIEEDGSLYAIDPTTGSREAVGHPGGWKGTRLTAILGDHMYSIERGSGSLWKTELATGTWVAIGGPDFAAASRLISDGTLLYTIELDGTLYRVWP